MFKGYGHFHIFTFFYLIFASVKEKSHLASSLLARSCRYLPVSHNYQNTPNGSSAVAIFANWQRTDRRTHKVIIGHSSKVNISSGRICQRFCRLCNNETAFSFWNTLCLKINWRLKGRFFCGRCENRMFYTKRFILEKKTKREILDSPPPAPTISPLHLHKYWTLVMFLWIIPVSWFWD